MGEERIVIGIILGVLFTYILFRIYMYARDLERKYLQAIEELKVKTKLEGSKDGTVRRRSKHR